MFEAAVFAQRRQRLMDAIGPDAVAVFHSPPEAIRNGDAHYRYRQSSDLLYLTGFTEPEATLVLRPGAAKHRVVMFVRPRDKERETWDGRRAGVDGAVDRFGADVAYPCGELADKLPDLLSAEALYYSLGSDPAFDRTIASAIDQLRRRERRGVRPPARVVDPREVLHEMRLIKTPEEIAVLERAAAISVEAHTAAMAAAAPGTWEYELEALVDYTFRRRGGVGPGYTTIVGGGANATILHYVENDAQLRAGDLVLIDAGCEYGFYTADITRTFPVDGRFRGPQRDAYEVVLAAQREAIAHVRPGATLDDIHAAAVRVLTEGMVDLGLLPGPAEARVADGAYKTFYMHRTSHWLGMDVHDVGAYNRGGKPRPLAPGMVLTVEPGLYVAEDADGVPDALRGIGIRIEDDVLVTDDGCRNLTEAAPSAIADVEAACRAAAPAAMR
ncbi:MAG: Xaa-Pro aminopeptidase [Deltaproteobacteria bacterium]|nr:MAG: Xaa-Pro aminopeptidase [Deltaproteobacteria bacterium]